MVMWGPGSMRGWMGRVRHWHMNWVGWTGMSRSVVGVSVRRSQGPSWWFSRVDAVRMLPMSSRRKVSRSRWMRWVSLGLVGWCVGVMV
ncbi:Uncharacterised protein [Dermatophilus congolensis]|uniref:Uncharacterized protein n=1 Tax=Dermatophilus congolensis TaxID=1863 RepID=A0AA46BLB2_9MICO|nr:Uncharacterised protein [Dermatophilus congolensis]